MAYQAISTLADTNDVDATYLNKLADNAQFLYDVMACKNWGCAAQSLESTGDMDNTDHLYRIRHRNQYLRWRVEAASALDYIRVFYDGIHVGGDESPGTSPHSGSIDLDDITSWPNYEGAWTTATAYYVDDIVLNDGDYYICISGHTSGSADDEPGDGAVYTTYWTAITLPDIGELVDVYVDFDLSGSDNWMQVCYLMETEDSG